MLIRVPHLFLLDHADRGLDTPEVVKATKAHFWIESTDPHFAELISDANFYGGQFPGTDDARMTRAARAFLAAVKSQQSDPTFTVQGRTYTPQAPSATLTARVCIRCGNSGGTAAYTVQDDAGVMRSVFAHRPCVVKMRQPKNAAAVALGSVRSARKAAAARINGAKGGRPRKVASID